jgi:arylsulfatase A-like enzyme
MSKLNIVLIIADSWRQDHAGCYGNQWIRTPNLDRLAGLSTRFTRCYSESLPTLPVCQAMLSGRRSAPLKGPGPVFADKGFLQRNSQCPQPTVAEMLRQAGYHTALVTDNPAFLPPGLAAQWPDIASNLGFMEVAGIGVPVGEAPSAAVFDEDIAGYTVSDEHALAVAAKLRPYLATIKGRKEEQDWAVAEVYRRAAQLLEFHTVHETEAPFFLMIHHRDPHEPWDPPQSYTDLYDRDYQGRARAGIEPLSGNANWLTERELKHLRALYAGEVTLCDAWLGKFFDRLGELGLMDRTLVVFLGSHGVALGEHDLTGQTPSALYPELMDIPALYYDPAIKGGKVVSGLIYNIDLLSTLVNRLGLASSELLAGIDIREMIAGGHAGRPHLVSTFGEFVYVRTTSHVLIAHAKGSQFQLYDLAADPKHDRNIANQRRDLCQEMFALATKNLV